MHGRDSFSESRPSGRCHETPTVISCRCWAPASQHERRALRALSVCALRVVAGSMVQPGSLSAGSLHRSAQSIDITWPRPWECCCTEVSACRSSQHTVHLGASPFHEITSALWGTRGVHPCEIDAHSELTAARRTNDRSGQLRCLRPTHKRRRNGRVQAVQAAPQLPLQSRSSWPRPSRLRRRPKSAAGR